MDSESSSESIELADDFVSLLFHTNFAAARSSASASASPPPPPTEEVVLLELPELAVEAVDRADEGRPSTKSSSRDFLGTTAAAAAAASFRAAAASIAS